MRVNIYFEKERGQILKFNGHRLHKVPQNGYIVEVYNSLREGGDGAPDEYWYETFHGAIESIRSHPSFLQWERKESCLLHAYLEREGFKGWASIFPANDKERVELL